MSRAGCNKGGQGGTTRDASPLEQPPSLPRSVRVVWGRQDPQGNNPVGKCLLYLLCGALSHAGGAVVQLLQQTGSAPHPRRQQDQPPPLLRQLEPALHQPANKKLLFACVILDYCSISRSPGKLAYAELVASALPSSSAAEAELPPGFDLSWCNFDGQSLQKKKTGHWEVAACVFLASDRLSRSISAHRQPCCWKETPVW